MLEVGAVMAARGMLLGVVLGGVMWLGLIRLLLAVAR